VPPAVSAATEAVKPAKPWTATPKASRTAALGAGVANDTVTAAVERVKATTEAPGRALAHDVAEAAAAVKASTPPKAATSPLPPADNEPDVSPLVALAETGLEQARRTFATLQEQRDAWNRNLIASASTTTKAATVINGKVLDLVRTQTDATFGLWRALLDVSSVAEAVELQTRELRRQYENTTTRVRDIAETASRFAQEAAAPLAKGTRPHA
jgi:hypothetical protein